MAASPASYAALGLPPGADRKSVDRAYRTLMKRHHPDLGGDPARAASINHAYADITRPADAPVTPPSPVDLAAAIYQRRQAVRREAKAGRRHRSRRPLWFLLAAFVGGLAWVEREELTDLFWQLKWEYFQPGSEALPDGDIVSAGGGAGRVTLGSAPIDNRIIAEAEQAARERLRQGSIGAASEASRECFISFYAAPSLARYDRCVAFDNAVLLISGYGVADHGGFSAGAVTSRQMGAAKVLDSNFESIEIRLDRIRLAMMRQLKDPAVAGISV